MKSYTPSMAGLEPEIKSARRSQHFKGERSQKKVTSYLQIASVPITERINPKENRYVLMIQPQGVRACGGQYTADEVHEIGRLTKKWDWSLDENNRPCCLPELEQLLDSIIKQVNQGGEA